MIDSALAGHAGDAGAPGLMPHEIAGALGLLAILVVATLLVGLVAVWLLLRIDRRLRTSAGETRPLTTDPPPSPHRK
jgi:hypothetical protein